VLTINPFWIGMGSNPDIRSERVATNHLRTLSIGGMTYNGKKTKYSKKKFFTTIFPAQIVHLQVRDLNRNFVVGSQMYKAG